MPDLMSSSHIDCIFFFYSFLAEFKTLCPDGYGRVVDPSGGIVGPCLQMVTQMHWCLPRSFLTILLCI